MYKIKTRINLLVRVFCLSLYQQTKQLENMKTILIILVVLIAMYTLAVRIGKFIKKNKASENEYQKYLRNQHISNGI